LSWRGGRGGTGADGGGRIGDTGFGCEDRRCRTPVAGAALAPEAGFAWEPNARFVPDAESRFVRSEAPPEGAARRAPGEDVSARLPPGAGRLRRRVPAVGVATGVEAGAWAGDGGAGAAAATEGDFGGFLPWCARQAREVGAFGAAVGSTGLTILRVGRAMGEMGRRCGDNLAS
jgi:hypothetical protein